MKRFGLLLACLAVAGCSLRAPAPSLLQHLNKPVTVVQPRSISDMDILLYAQGLKELWGGRSLRAQAADVGGALTLSALSTGAVVASSAQASSSVIAAIVAAGSFFSQALGAVDPVNRVNALNEGLGIVIEAESEYFLSLAASKARSPSANQITVHGAMFLGKLNAAVNSVNRLFAGLLPRAQDLEWLKKRDALIVEMATGNQATIP